MGHVTLYTEIRKIDEISDLSENEKKEAYKKVFEKWSREKPIVKRVLNLETTFYKEFEKESERYTAGKSFIPWYFKYSETQEAVEECIGNIWSNGKLESVFHSLLNPPVAAGLSYLSSEGVVNLTTRKLKKKGRKITRRDFLGHIICVTGLGAGFGFVGPAGRHNWLRDAKKYALYLDEKKSYVFGD